jgi:deoxycytidylate deaminase
MKGVGSRDVVAGQASNEFVFAVVGHAGSGTSAIGGALKTLMEGTPLSGTNFDVSILKARKVIEEWARDRGELLPAPGAKRSLKDIQRFQDLGDQMRAEQTDGGKPDYAAVARALIELIPRTRAAKTGVNYQRGQKVEPDGKPRAFILDSIRHPAEVQLLRRVYGDAFVLIGVVCEEEKRTKRIQAKCNCGPQDAYDFMKRDADDEMRYGQHVADAFHLSDFFIDNTVDRERNGASNRDWNVIEDLSRLLKIITHTELVRPSLSETSMYHAFSAQMQSACLSRQVGAAVVDRQGNVLSTGTNEVPKAGGGVYGESAENDTEDARCAFFPDAQNRFCRNTTQQNEIIDELLNDIKEFKEASPERRIQIKKEIRKTRIGGLLEFSRAVHAEMDALLSAGRQSISVEGAMLFVTTYPCHYCARHLITAGIDEVQYIEPYPKSQALRLHHDSIVIEVAEWRELATKGVKKVLFHPFSGVAPRLYERSFLKDRELKEKDTGIMRIQEPEWTSPWHLPVTSYVEIEATLARRDQNDG